MALQPTLKRRRVGSEVTVWSDCSGMDAPLYALKRLGVAFKATCVNGNGDPKEIDVEFIRCSFV